MQNTARLCLSYQSHSWIPDFVLHSLDFQLQVKTCACVLKLLQSYLTLCNPTDCSPSGSSAHGILQARILEWVVTPSFRGSSWRRNWTCVSCGSCISGRFFTTEPPGKPQLRQTWGKCWEVIRGSPPSTDAGTALCWPQALSFPLSLYPAPTESPYHRH